MSKDREPGISDEEIQGMANRALAVKVMVLGLARNIGEVFGIGMLPTILGIMDAAMQLGKVMLVEAEKHEGEAGARGTLIMLKDKLSLMERQWDHQTTHASDARNASTN